MKTLELKTLEELKEIVKTSPLAFYSYQLHPLERVKLMNEAKDFLKVEFSKRSPEMHRAIKKEIEAIEASFADTSVYTVDFIREQIEDNDIEEENSNVPLRKNRKKSGSPKSL